MQVDEIIDTYSKKANEKSCCSTKTRTKEEKKEDAENAAMSAAMVAMETRGAFMAYLDGTDQ